MKKTNKFGSITLRNFIVLLVLFPLFFGLFYISGFKGLFYLFLSLFLYFIVYFIIAALYTKYIKKDFIIFTQILENFLYRITITIVVTFLIVGLFLVYNNNISPASLPIYKLQSNNKEVIFQTMSHIGTKKFYNQVEQNIINAKQKGYVLFYEGVKVNKKIEKKEIKTAKEILIEKLKYKVNKNYISNEKLQEEFNKALGIKFDKDLYKNLSKMYGLVPQNNNQFLGLIDNNDFNVDLSLEEIMKIYKQKIKNKPKSKKIINIGKVEDLNKQIIEKLNNLNKKELKLLVWVNRGIMNFIIKNDDFRKKIMSITGKQDIMGVILEDRNRNLAKEIQKSKYKKIYVIYGLMHFEGVFKELKKMDNSWEIKEKKDIFFIK